MTQEKEINDENVRAYIAKQMGCAPEDVEQWKVDAQKQQIEEHPHVREDFNYNIEE